MAFKAVGGAPKVRLEKLSKAELIRTIKTLQKRETKLLNQVAKLQSTDAPRLLELSGVNDGSFPAGAALDDHLEDCTRAERRRALGPFPWEDK